MRRSNRAARRRTVSLALALAVAPLGLASTARADRYWENGITADSWSSSTDWNATSAAGTDSLGAPGSADNAYITNTDALNEVITLDDSEHHQFDQQTAQSDRANRGSARRRRTNQCGNQGFLSGRDISVCGPDNSTTHDNVRRTVTRQRKRGVE
jgi:hypothetical protein